MEIQGLKPWTPCLQSRCSNQLSYIPVSSAKLPTLYILHYDFAVIKCILNYMVYEFSWTAFFVGIIILACGGALTIWHQQIADNFGSGIGSYERYRLCGLIGCVLGFLVMLNIHSVLLHMFFSLFFSGMSR